ncbi:alpha/beta fold hydrolase [Paraburkholderia silviterrae]|uniref:Alpha/beta hydrolase n=1 Tax=Paraburkholderia silviterrae TaxID=2528715 RepID=A0A4R5LX92_9BURK|nr:alpha/beta hydrolase [Paraburkholderia silviterrae]TDG16593.1 alpha/beta hydrolase [Paraburkholderia silviterrae]
MTRLASCAPAWPIETLTLTCGPHTYTALAAGPQGGECVLLLHGWPEFADCWCEILTALAAAGYRAIAVDQRGYSQRARPMDIASYTATHLESDALAFADQIGAAQFHLIAHDWGGLVAWGLASRHPHRLRSLSVLATPHPLALQLAMRDDEQHQRLNYVRNFRLPGGVAEQRLLADGAAALRAAYLGRVPPSLVDENVRRLGEPGALSATLNWYRALPDDLCYPAGRVAVPTLYIWGTEDRALGREAAQLTGDFVDGPYRLEILEGASHWLPEESPDRIVPMLLDHLASSSLA